MNIKHFAILLSLSSTFALADHDVNLREEFAQSVSENGFKDFSLKYLEATLGEIAFSTGILTTHEVGHAVTNRLLVGRFPIFLRVAHDGNMCTFPGTKFHPIVLFAGPAVGFISTMLLETAVLSSTYATISHVHPLYWMMFANLAKLRDLGQLRPFEGPHGPSDGRRIIEQFPGWLKLYETSYNLADSYFLVSLYKSVLQNISPDLGNSIADYAPLVVYLFQQPKQLISCLPAGLISPMSIVLSGYVLYSYGSLIYRAYQNLPEQPLEKLKELFHDLSPYLLASLTKHILYNNKILDFQVTWADTSSFFSGVLSRPKSS